MAEFLFLLAGIALGAIVGFLFAQLKNKNQTQAQAQHQQNEIAKYKELHIQAEATLLAWKKQQEENEKHLKDSFEALAGKAIQNNNEHFLQLARQSFEKHSEHAETDLDKRRESIEKLIAPLRESLTKHENLIGQLQSHNDKTFGSLKNYLEHLAQSQKSLERETGALVSALKSPKVRGRWGEIGLKRIVEFSGMSAYCDFQEQVHVSNSEGNLRPDMIVSLPDNKQIVVDSKVPLNAYLDAMETPDDNQREALLSRHAKALAQHVRELSGKAYWEQLSESVDFVVLYIEVESAFAAALLQNKNLIAEALKNRVMFATPTTLITLLQTVAYTWRQHSATENALKIWQSGKELYSRLAVFAGHLEKTGAQLNALTRSYNQAVGSWQSRVLPAIKRLEDLGAGSEKQNVSPLDSIDQTPRQLPKNE